MAAMDEEKNSRKRAASSAQEGTKPKKNKASSKAPEPKPKKSTGVLSVPDTRRSKRAHAPAPILDSDEDIVVESDPPAPKMKSKGNTSTGVSLRKVDAPPPPKKLAKKSKKTEASNEDESADSEPSAESSKEEDDSGSLSAEENPEDVAAQLEQERPRVIPRGHHDDEMDVDDNAAPPRHRRSSLSSRGSAPPLTDFDSEGPDGPEQLFDDDDDGESEKPADNEDQGVEEDEEEEEEAQRTVPRKSTKSAQQAKYDLEKPVIKTERRAVKAESKVDAATNQSQYHRTARIVFPVAGGEVGLKAQNSMLQEVVRAAMEKAQLDCVFKDAYPDSAASRAVIACRWLVKAARVVGAPHIEARAKVDDAFCQVLGKLLFARVALLRKEIKQVIGLKGEGYYQLSGHGLTVSEVRGRANSALDDDHYIFPRVWVEVDTAIPTTTTAAAPAAPPVTTAAADDAAFAAAAPATTTSAKAKATKIEMKFQSNLPFHSAPIIDTIHEKFFSKPRYFGVKFKKHLKGPADHPDELELPDAMMALVAVHLCGRLHSWKTGRYIDAESSQERLETTYKELLQILADMRMTQPEESHRVLHQLYLSASHNAPVTSLSKGSAMRVLNLGAADEDALI